MHPRRTLSASLLVLFIVSIGCGPGPAGSTASPAPTPTTALATATSVAPGPSPNVSPTPRPDPTLTPANPPSAFADWTRADLPDPAPGVFGGGTPNDLIWFNGRYIAVGTINAACCADGDPSTLTGVVWTSRDGRTWRLRDLGTTFRHASLSRLVVIDGVLLAFGAYAESTPGRIAESTGAAWSSTDGATWHRVPGEVPGMVMPFGSGAVGIERTGEPDTEYARFMHSADGLTWSYTSDAFDIDIRGLAVDAGGHAVAIGVVPGPIQPEGTRREDAVVFRSNDGLSWTGPTVALQSAFPTSITAIQGGFLITGWAAKPPPSSGNQESAALWRTTDGTKWEAVPLVVGDEESFSEVFVVGDKLILGGSTTVDGLGNQMLWVSTDAGLSWGRVADQPAFDGINNDMAAMRVARDGLLAVGRRWDPGSGHPIPQLWRSTL